MHAEMKRRVELGTFHASVFIEILIVSPTQPDLNIIGNSVFVFYLTDSPIQNYARAIFSHSEAAC